MGELGGAKRGLELGCGRFVSGELMSIMRCTTDVGRICRDFHVVPFVAVAVGLRQLLQQRLRLLQIARVEPLSESAADFR
jgi:hypothetical protein